MYKIRNRYRIFLMIIINKNQKNFPLFETFVYQIDQRKKKSSPMPEWILLAPPRILISVQ